mmetsp:Transcript_34557/g.49084  ORF Transcript_34557/g.49084 Transcript_34557/m.49084 type:complete len:84 (+) Transcript_34557:78-329(+)
MTVWFFQRSVPIDTVHTKQMRADNTVRTVVKLRGIIGMAYYMPISSCIDPHAWIFKNGAGWHVHIDFAKDIPWPLDRRADPDR